MMMPKRWRSLEELRLPEFYNLLQERDTLLNEKSEWKKREQMRESEVTELYSVIADLRKELGEKKQNVIEEEEEEEEEEEVGNNEGESDGTDIAVGPGELDLDDYFEDHIGDSMLQSDGNEIEKITQLHSMISHNQHSQRIQQQQAQSPNSTTTTSPPGNNGNRNNGSEECKCKYAKKVRLSQKSPRGIHSPMMTTTTNATANGLSLPSTPIKGADLVNLIPHFDLDTSVVEKLVNVNEAFVYELNVELGKEELLLLTEQMTLRMEKMQGESDFLLQRLAEAKEVNEEMEIQLGTVESWGTAWKCIGERGESTIELYDILVALLESELGLLLANVKAAGIGGTTVGSESEVRSLLKRAQLNRETAVGAARRRVSKEQRQISNNNGRSRNNGCSLEQEIRSMIIQLKTQTATLFTTIPYYDFNTKRDNLVSAVVNGTMNTKKVDLEMAILMQELLACREEKVGLKLKLVQVEKILLRSGWEAAGSGESGGNGGTVFLSSGYISNKSKEENNNNTGWEGLMMKNTTTIPSPRGDKSNNNFIPVIHTVSE